MTRLNELIAGLCPDGVEYKTLGEVCEIKTGVGITKKDSTDDGIYQIISGGVEPLGMYNKSNRKARTVTIARAGSAGYVNFIDKDFYLNDKCFSIIPANQFSKKINTRFLYYSLKNQEQDIMAMKSKGSVPTVNTTKVASIQIPLPPLAVQEEIVRILDKFTSLTAELTAELTARRAQYEYYRDALLTPPFAYGYGKQTDLFAPNGTHDKERKSLDLSKSVCEYKKLGEIGKVCMCKRILKNQTSSTGDVPFFKIGTFGKEPDAFISKELFEEYKQKYSYPKKGDVLISAAGTIGRTVIFDGKPAYFQDSNIVWIDNDEKQALNKYLYYCYQRSPWKVSTGGTIARLYNENIENAEIPLPPLPVQQRIVSVLDNFDAICADLKIGLPAEIEARKKQYEYYRDLLLNFKRK